LSVPHKEIATVGGLDLFLHRQEYPTLHAFSNTRTGQNSSQADKSIQGMIAS
jgi:hypothetical protein